MPAHHLSSAATTIFVAFLLTLAACGNETSGGANAGDSGAASDAATADTADQSDAPQADASVEAAQDVESQTSDANATSKDAGTTSPGDAQGQGGPSQADKDAAKALEGMYQVGQLELDGKGFDEKDPNADAKTSLPFPLHGLKYVKVQASELAHPGDDDKLFRLALYPCDGADASNCDDDYFTTFEVLDGEVSSKQRIKSRVCDCKGDKFTNPACLPAGDAKCSLHWFVVAWQWDKAADGKLSLVGSRAQCKTSQYGCETNFDGTQKACEGQASYSYGSAVPKCIGTKAKQTMTLTAVQ